MGDRLRPADVQRTRGRPRSANEARSEGRIRSIQRAVLLMRALSVEGSATLKVLAAITELPSSTVFRVLETLRRDDIVEFHDKDQTWTIGVESFRIGQSYARRVSFMDIGRQVMRDLADCTNETCNMAVLEANAAIYVSQIESLLPIRAFIPPTTRVPLHASATGKAMLAYMDVAEARRRLAAAPLVQYTEHTLTSTHQLCAELEAIRARGWAEDHEERYVGMRCIAAPIFNEFCEPIAGLSISGPAKRFDDVRAPELAALVVKAAQTIVAQSGGRSHSRVESG